MIKVSKNVNIIYRNYYINNLLNNGVDVRVIFLFTVQTGSVCDYMNILFICLFKLKTYNDLLVRISVTYFFQSKYSVNLVINRRFRQLCSL